MPISKIICITAAPLGLAIPMYCMLNPKGDALESKYIPGVRGLFHSHATAYLSEARTFAATFQLESPSI